MTLPPVRIAMSSSIALRRSPKPGALTAATLSVPRSLLTTKRRESFALDVFGDDEQRTAHLGDLFEDRQQVAASFEIFFSLIRMKGSSRTASMRSGSVTKYGER